MFKKGLVVLFFFSILSILAVFLYNNNPHKSLITEPLAAPSKCTYNFLNPHRCEPELAVKKKEYLVLRNKLLEYIEQKQQAGELKSAGVYFRDLQNGPTLSINSQEDFIPASLLKIPLMLTYYKKAEEDPSLLTRKVTISEGTVSLEQNITPKETAVVGKTYTIDELIHLLITQSDNIAWKTLLTYLRKYYSEQDYIDTLSDLGIVDPRKEHDQQYINVASYASIFRILFNGSYLNLEMSNKALETLSKSSFMEGIVAGVPEGTRVAHKFGERLNDDEQQLHDCGIVYYDRNPYILCVMTRGDNITTLETVIKEISKDVYEEVTHRS